MAALLGVLGAGCASSKAWFRPRERAVAEAPSGETAAEYVLGTAARRAGELRVWSDGARASKKGCVVRVGFEIENESDRELRLDLDATRLENVEAGGREPRDVPQERVASGRVEIPPDRMGRVDLEYLIEGARPTGVRAFVVRWRVVDDAGGRFEQRTPFVRDVRRRYGYSRWSFPLGFTYVYGYDPWWPCW